MDLVDIVHLLVETTVCAFGPVSIHDFAFWPSILYEDIYKVQYAQDSKNQTPGPGRWTLGGREPQLLQIWV